MNNQEIFIEANKALAEGNYAVFMTYCSEDIKWVNVGKSTFHGKAELFKYISSAYEGLVFTTENYIKEKDFVVEFGQIVFENSGESEERSYCDIWKFKDSLISQVTSYVI